MVKIDTNRRRVLGEVRWARLGVGEGGGGRESRTPLQPAGKLMEPARLRLLRHTDGKSDSFESAFAYLASCVTGKRNLEWAFNASGTGFGRRYKAAINILKKDQSARL